MSSSGKCVVEAPYHELFGPHPLGVTVRETAQAHQGGALKLDDDTATIIQNINPVWRYKMQEKSVLIYTEEVVAVDKIAFKDYNQRKQQDGGLKQT